MSEETGEPFHHCIRCRLPLLEIDARWLVIKDYKHEECMMEYAICEPCRNQTSAGFSEQSKAAVREFLATRIDWDARVEDFMMDSTLESRFACCIGCRTPREHMAGYGISALFDPTGDLIEGPLPLLICDKCTRDLVSRLAPADLASWQDFISSHFEGPPGDGDWPGQGYSGLL
ncbi:hypothetical protein [Luteolibacter sp. LG18]|uniref:hypothetical protein n=1 Tax=Luteolibacter sp. LG18 TaxID=2819286 RepID=UPI0030C77B6A